MASKRMLAKNILTSDKIDKLTWFQEVLYYRLLVGTDDYGCCPSAERAIKDNLFPGKKVSIKSIHNALVVLLEVGLLERRVFNKYPILELKQWSRFQKLRSDRGKHSFFGMTDDIPPDIPPDIPKDKDKVKDKDKGRGCHFLLNTWRSKNPEYARAYPKHALKIESAISAALKSGYTHQEIEKIIWDTAGKNVPPWELFPKKTDIPSMSSYYKPLEKLKEEGVPMPTEIKGMISTLAERKKL